MDEATRHSIAPGRRLNTVLAPRTRETVNPFLYKIFRLPQNTGMKSLTPSRLDLGNASILFRCARAEEVYPLRMLVLIAGTDRSSPEFSGDRDPQTLHIVGEIDGEIVTAASWMASEWEGEPAYQLRGMATAPGWQRRGLGKNLLVYSENSIAGLGGGAIIWCNARLSALDFYLRQGWIKASEPFEIPGVGPHYRLRKTLAKDPLANAAS